jgi:hypothetical protein
MIHAGRCDIWSAWKNHHALQFPMGYYCAAEVTGPEAIMTMIPELMVHRIAEVAGVEAIVSTIPEPTERRTYGMCGVIHFCIAVPSLR